MTAALSMAHGYAQLLPIRAGALTISILIHALFFIGYGGSISAPSSESINTSVTRLSFLAPAPIPDVVPDRPQEKPEPKKVPPKVKKIVKPVEAVREVAEAEPEKVEPVPEVQPMQQMASASSDASPQINEGVIQRETERYLSSIMAHIEQHKWYPKAARRRGIEGEVHVRFTLHPDGSIRELAVENGSSVLLTASRQAVERAIPMPKPPATVPCPLECEFRMRFSLNAT